MTIRAYSPGRNGMPERVNYAYRGDGGDQLTGHLGAEQLARWKPDYEQWLPGFERGSSSPRRGKDACRGCGYKRDGRNCQVLCGGAR